MYILGVFFISLFASTTLALLKLAGGISWSWLAVVAPLLGFYVLFAVAMYCFSRQRDTKKNRKEKR